jgi:hypothetical protein
MNFTYSENPSTEFSGTLYKKSFPDLDRAKKYCTYDEYCVGISDDSEGISAVTSFDPVSTNANEMSRIYSKDSTKIFDGTQMPVKLLSNEIINKYPNGYIRNFIMETVERDAKVILVLYKCKTEQDRIGLNFSGSDLFGVMFMSQTGFQLNKIVETAGLPAGKYIARQIFYYDAETDLNADYSIVFNGSQLVTYVDDIMVKRTWQLSGGYVHSVNLSLSKGKHSFINDFSFDTNSLKFTIGTDSYDSFFMPKLGTDYLVASYNNDLFYSVINANKDSACTADTLTDAKCLVRLRSEDLARTTRMQIAEYEVESILPFVELIYSDDTIDYDVKRTVKQKAESLLINKIMTLDFSNIPLLIFLMKLVSNEVLEKLTRSDFLEQCSDESSIAFKSGLCRQLENSIPDNEYIVKAIDRRNYIYCTQLDAQNMYTFEYGNEDRCSKIQPEIKKYFMANKCVDDDGNFKDNEWCRSKSMIRASDESKRRDIHFDKMLDKQIIMPSRDKIIEAESIERNIEYSLISAKQKLETAKSALASMLAEPETIIVEGFDDSEQVTSEQVTSEQAASEQVTSEQVALEQATLEQATLEQATSEQATLEQAASEQVTSEQVALEQILPTKAELIEIAMKAILDSETEIDILTKSYEAAASNTLSVRSEYSQSADLHSQDLQYITNRYIDDTSKELENYDLADKVLTETLMNQYETSDCIPCETIYDDLLSKDIHGEVRSKLLASKKKKEVYKCATEKKCDNMFNTDDELSVLLYSNEVAKFCGDSPFDTNCVTYYDFILSKAQAAAEQPLTENPVAEQPLTENPVAEQPLTENPVAEQPLTENPVAEQPFAENPVAEQPFAENPAVEQPFSENTAAEQTSVESFENYTNYKWVFILLFLVFVIVFLITIRIVTKTTKTNNTMS